MAEDPREDMRSLEDRAAASPAALVGLGRADSRAAVISDMPTGAETFLKDAATTVAVVMDMAAIMAVAGAEDFTSALARPTPTGPVITRPAFATLLAITTRQATGFLIQDAQSVLTTATNAQMKISALFIKL